MGIMSYVECKEGVYDCLYNKNLSDDTNFECSPYNNQYRQLEGELWVVVASTIVMAGMGLSIGGNDVANAWGTSVGSGAIKVKHALAVAAISNVLGAILLGSGVADKLQHGVTALDSPQCFACGYCNSRMSLYSLGMLSALLASSAFIFLATTKKMPVSTTHAIVGSIVGITVGANRDVSRGVGGIFHGLQCVNWTINGVNGMVISWVLSPVLAGVLSCLLYSSTSGYIYESTLEEYPWKSEIIEIQHDENQSRCHHTMTDNCDKRKATERTLRLLPSCYGGMTWTMSYLIFSKSNATKSFSLWTQLGVSFSAAIAAFLFAYFGLIPHLTKRLIDGNILSAKENSSKAMKMSTFTQSTTPALSDDSVHSCDMDKSSNALVNDKSAASISFEHGVKRGQTNEINFCFQYLLICVAALESFAHGANDTANSTAPFSAVVRVYNEGLYSCSSSLHTPIWVMTIGGSFVAIGVMCFGKGVIETIGRNLTASLDCHKGFCIEFSSCMAVILASTFGLPVSTTHCQVGAVVAIGIQSTGVRSVNWTTIKDIILSWLLTVPFAALLAAGILSMLKLLL